MLVERAKEKQGSNEPCLSNQPTMKNYKSLINNMEASVWLNAWA